MQTKWEFRELSTNEIWTRLTDDQRDLISRRGRSSDLALIWQLYQDCRIEEPKASYVQHLAGVIRHSGTIPQIINAVISAGRKLCAQSVTAAA